MTEKQRKIPITYPDDVNIRTHPLTKALKGQRYGDKQMSQSRIQFGVGPPAYIIQATSPDPLE